MIENITRATSKGLDTLKTASNLSQVFNVLYTNAESTIGLVPAEQQSDPSTNGTPRAGLLVEEYLVLNGSRPERYARIRNLMLATKIGETIVDQDKLVGISFLEMPTEVTGYPDKIIEGPLEVIGYQNNYPVSVAMRPIVPRRIGGREVQEIAFELGRASHPNEMRSPDSPTEPYGRSYFRADLTRQKVFEQAVMARQCLVEARNHNTVTNNLVMKDRTNIADVRRLLRVVDNIFVRLEIAKRLVEEYSLAKL